MDVTGTLINTFVVVAVGAFLAYVIHDRARQLRREVRGDIARLEADISGVKGEIGGVKGDIARLERDVIARLEAEISGLDGRLAVLRQELKGDIARLEARMDAGFNAVRSDLTAVALAVGAGPHRASGETGRA